MRSRVFFASGRLRLKMLLPVSEKSRHSLTARQRGSRIPSCENVGSGQTIFPRPFLTALRKNLRREVASPKSAQLTILHSTS